MLKYRKYQFQAEYSLEYARGNTESRDIRHALFDWMQYHPSMTNEYNPAESHQHLAK